MEQSAALVIVAIILELAGGIYILVNGTENSQLTPWLDEHFHKLIIDSNYDDRANRLLQSLQEKVCFFYSSFSMLLEPLPLLLVI